MTINGPRLRKHWPRPEWCAPTPRGPDGWQVVAADRSASIIISVAPWLQDGVATNWVHASISRSAVMPSYEDLVRLKASVWGPDGEAYQVFAPVREHVNIHEHALHLWGRADGKGVLPRFGIYGSI